MNSGRNSLLLIGAIVLVVYLWFQSQSKTRGIATTQLAKQKQAANQTGSIGKFLGGLLAGLTKPSGSGSGAKGGGGSAPAPGSGAGTAAGQKMCGKTPGTSFCGCNSCLAYAGQDSSGNEIYQRPDGSLVYADGSPASENDIVCAAGACAGTAFNQPCAVSTPQGPCLPQPQCQPQCVDTAQPCFSAGAYGGCSCGGCFCSAGAGCAAGCFG